MSVAETVARVSALEATITATGGAQPQPPAAPGFDAQLARAQAAAPAGDASVAGPADGPFAAQPDVPFAAQIDAAATREGVDPAVLRGLIRQESGFNPAATSGAGAEGLTQLIPATAAALGVTDPYDPAQAIDGGARYLRAQLDRTGGDYTTALAAYNAGPAAVERFGGIPPYAETREYVAKVLGYAQQYRSEGTP